MDCNRRTAHEHIISCWKLSLAQQAKQTLPKRLMQRLLTGKLALDVVQQSCLQTARLHRSTDLSPSMRRIEWQVVILISYKSHWGKDVMVCVQFCKWVNYPRSGGLTMCNVFFSFGIHIFSISNHGCKCARMTWSASDTSMQFHVAFVTAPFIRT